MKKELLFFCSLISALGVGWTAQAAVYNEAGGIVVVEAEHFDSRTAAQDDDHHYAIAPDELTSDQASSPLGGYIGARGGKYMVCVPENGQNRNTTDLQDVGPYMDFKVQINTTGDYQLYLRAIGYDGGSDSAYVRIVELQKANGGLGPDWYRIAPNPDDATFDDILNFPFDTSTTAGWTGNGNAEVNNGGDNGDDGPIVWTISKAGVYTIRYQQREDGNALDALVLQRSNLPIPATTIPESQIVGATPQPLALIGQTPAAGTKAAAFNTAITFNFLEGTTTLDKGSVVLKLDNNAVTPQITSGAGGAVTVTYQPTNGFAALSTHTVSLDYKDSAGKAGNTTFSFTVQNYITIPASAVVQADTTKKGFLVRTYQTDTLQANTLDKADQVLAGLLGPNVVANPSIFTDQEYGNKYFDETNTINYWDSGAGADGDFTNNDTQNTPGMANDGTDDNNYVMEFIAFLDLPAGLVKMGVNSDDDFRTQFTPSGDPRDKSAVTLGFFQGGRGAADTILQFVVEKAGTYGFRTVYYEMGGGSEVEWFTVGSDGKKHLINDSTDAGSIKAYRAAATGPYLQSLTPADAGFTLQLGDGSTRTVDASSVKVSLDGTALSGSATQASGVTTFAYKPSAPWDSGTKHTVTVTFKDSSGVTSTVTANFTAPMGHIPASYAWGAADKSKPGFLVRTYKTTAGEPNTIEWAEDQLAGLHGSNIVAKPSVFTDAQFGNKYFDETGTINYWNSGGEGNFANNATQNTPGLANDGTNDDNYTLEILTFLDLPAGQLSMGVNSDDGFRVYALPSGNPADKGFPLGEFNAGRGSADTIFTLTVDKAGIYPFRMVYEEGGGDSEVEWFTQTSDGTDHLINDSSDPAAIKAYRAASGGPQPSQQPKFNPVTVSGTSLSISWSGGGALESADNVNGPYTTVTGASNPATIQITGARKFYRIKQ